MPLEPCHALFRHVILRVLDVADDKLVLILEVIEKLRMRHSGLGGDIAQGYLRDGLCRDAALEGLQYLHSHFVMVNYCRHCFLRFQMCQASH